MDAESLRQEAESFVMQSPLNLIGEEDALAPETVGLRMYDLPILSFGAADDPVFAELAADPVVGKHFMTPVSWLPAAKTVISYFFPFTDRVVRSNREDFDWPSKEWLHARYDGRKLIGALSRHLCELLISAGYPTLNPTADSRFWCFDVATPSDSPTPPFTSNWSERHVAYVCGLGTFGLSKSLITERGTAGRLGSIITTLELSPTPKKYTSYEEYCNKCGCCAAHCPAGAITLEQGKDHRSCHAFLRRTMDPVVKARSGCGKCQVDVPCERGIPVITLPPQKSSQSWPGSTV